MRIRQRLQLMTVGRTSSLPTGEVTDSQGPAVGVVVAAGEEVEAGGRRQLETRAGGS